MVTNLEQRRAVGHVRDKLDYEAGRSLSERDHCSPIFTLGWSLIQVEPPPFG